jgi:hypothetical protein
MNGSAQSVVLSVPLLEISELPFTIDPFPHVLRTVNDFCARILRRSQKANNLHVGECQFRQIQDHFRSVTPELSGQFVGVFQLKMTNQANRRSLTARFRLDLQWARSTVFNYGCGSVQ